MATAKYYKFKPVEISLLRDFFNSEQVSNLLSHVNIYAHDNYFRTEGTKTEMYAYIQMHSLELGDLFENAFIAQEATIEEMSKLDDHPSYRVLAVP